MELTTGGIVFMSGAWIAILALNTFCFYKIFKKRDKKQK